MKAKAIKYLIIISTIILQKRNESITYVNINKRKNYYKIEKLIISKTWMLQNSKILTLISLNLSFEDNFFNQATFYHKLILKEVLMLSQI